ncbi:MBOAT family O-acyltransferase [Desulfobacter sp.]|uniref:MBOAT family O-acyltransferase n=1 Tax=Desulfobacter sp. TaxID=2294 RepID=UPI003D150855
MVFSSITFLFGFLPLFLIIFIAIPSSWRIFFLLISSLLFYFWGENFMIWVVIVSTLIDYLCALFIYSGFKTPNLASNAIEAARTRTQKAALTISIISRLYFLGYFKYYNFFIENALDFLNAIGLESVFLASATKVSLPLGISFYTFQAMSYTIDVYRGKVSATRSFTKFAAYVTMFPQLIAGPIVRYSDVEAQMACHNISSDQFAEGIRRFISGLGKKVLIANTLALAADRIFSLPSAELSFSLAWLGITTYTLQIYFDFSGYSCMAIGLGKMIGFTFPENFNYPYISKSIREFWRRWHISLSTWFRDYLYIPLGGNQHGRVRTYINLLIVFFICGLWHGANWTFIIWGLYHGAFIAIERSGVFKFLSKLPRIFRHLYAVLVIMIGWVFFRADNSNHAFFYLKAMAGMGESRDGAYILGQILSNALLLFLITGVLFSTPIFKVFRLSPLFPEDGTASPGHKMVSSLFLFAIFILCIMSLAAGTYNPFIYFRF